ncbi:MAG: starch-binding protein, partial [Muribaculaceae bacterium]
TPVKQTGRAYYGNYIEGDVTATDFGEYTATGNVATTLNADLAQHIIRLNKIRAAVPALRKGQYTFDGCSASSGFAFKRAYKDESYALVTINGGATFSNVPDGTYVDVVTGQSYTPTDGSITVAAPSNQGQLRVLVKDWTAGKVGEDGKYIYASQSVAHGGNVTFDDPGTTSYYTADDASTPKVIFSPADNTFTTETVTITASLNEEASSGWYQVADADCVTLSPGESSQFTIGAGMSYGESITVTWGADSYTGSVTYTKVDPNAIITIYVKAPEGTNLYAWGNDLSGNAVTPCGAWPGTTLTATTTVEGEEFYYYRLTQMKSVNIIFNRNGSQTSDITGITKDTYFEYDGASYAQKLDIGSGEDPEPSEEFTHHAYFCNDASWSKISAYAWDDNHSGSAAFSGGWPGTTLTETVEYNGMTLYHFSFTTDAKLSNPKIIFNNGGQGTQTSDLEFVECGIYNSSKRIGIYADGIDGIDAPEVKIYTAGGNLVVEAQKACTIYAVRVDGIRIPLKVASGLNYYHLEKGLYIVEGIKVVI